MRRLAILVLVCGAAIITVSLGIRAALGLFLKPISADLGLGREIFSLSLAISTLLNGIAGPFVGALADRYGAHKVVSFGALFFVAALVLGAMAESAYGLHGTFGLLFGIGSTALGMGIVFGAVARAVPAEKRTLAFGIVMSGGSFGQFLMIPIAQSMLAAWDWRMTNALMAIGAALMIPLAFGLRATERAAAAKPGGAASLREALREAAALPSFWFLTAAFFVCGFHVNFINTHLPAFLTDRGMTANVAAQALAFVGLFNIAGSLGAGWLGGHVKNRNILVFVYLMRAVIFLPLIFMPMSPALALVFAALMGLLYLSSVAPTSGIVAQIFGPKYFSTLYGIVFASHQFGGFLGSWLGGRLFDATGSYEIVWWIAIGLAVAAALLMTPVRETPLARPALAA